MKYRDQSNFKFIIEFVSNLKKNHSFYSERIKNCELAQDPQVQKESSQHMISLEVEIMRASYETTKNPIFIWRALMCCIDSELTFPKWVVDYFYNASLNILNASYSDNPKREKDLLADALGFKSSGRGNSFTRYKNSVEEIYPALAKVMHEKTTSDDSFETIEGRVANEAFPDDSVEADKHARNLRRWREMLQNIPKDLDFR